MTDSLSAKLQAIPLLLIFLVVLIHMLDSVAIIDRGGQGEPSRSVIGNTVMACVRPGMTSIAVPMFFTISGFLFFNGFHGTRDELVSKWQRRFWSLMVPYVLWSAIYLLAVCLWQSTPLTSLNPSIRVSYRVDELLTKLFLKPFGQHLWFVRDLLLLVLLSPFIWHLVRKYGYAPLLIMASLWLLGLCPGWDRQIISLTGPLFFTSGAYLAIRNIHLEVPVSGDRILGIGWLAFVVGAAYLLTSHDDSAQLALRIAILLGIPALWLNYDVLQPLLESQFAKSISPFVFFVYAGHYLTVPLLRNGLESLWPWHDYSLAFPMLLGTLIVVAIWIGIGAVIRAVFPALYDLLSGGRTSRSRRSAMQTSSCDLRLPSSQPVHDV